MEKAEKQKAGSWFSGVWQQYQHKKAGDAVIDQATERVVDIADPHIRAAGRYRKALRMPVEAARQYCTSLLAKVPGPVLLSRDRYHDDPQVKAVFASPESLEELLRLSPELSQLRDQGHAGPVMALMTMSLEEKTIFGYQREGEIVMRDVAQRAVNFYDHRLVAPAADIALTREGVVRRGLEVLATVAMERIETLQGKKAELQQKREYLRAAMKILSGRTQVLEMFAAPEPGKREEYRKAEELLAEVDRELLEVRDLIGRPEQSLAFLDGVLRNPADSLIVGQRTMRLNWMNVRVEGQAESDGHDVTLAEFSVPEIVNRSAMLVCFDGSSMQ